MVSFPFPILRMKDIEKAEDQMSLNKGSEIEIHSFSLLSFEGVDLGSRRLVICEYCYHGYKEPQYQCPKCKEYLI